MMAFPTTLTLGKDDKAIVALIPRASRFCDIVSLVMLLNSVVYGVDGYYQVVDYPVSVIIETVMYASWTVTNGTVAIASSVFPLKLVQVLRKSIKASKATNSLDEKSADLRRYVWQVGLVLLFCFSLLTTSPSPSV